MSLFDPVYLTAQGDPIPGRVPVRLVIEDGGAPTARQLAEIEAVYADFCTAKRLSVVRYHDAQRTLSDGSQVRLNSIAGVDTVHAWIAPADDLEPIPWVAYGAYTDLEWLDIYNRLVLGGDGGWNPPPGSGEEPKFEFPPPPPPPGGDMVAPLTYVRTISATGAPGEELVVVTTSLSGRVMRPSGTETTDNRSGVDNRGATIYAEFVQMPLPSGAGTLPTPQVFEVVPGTTGLVMSLKDDPSYTIDFPVASVFVLTGSEWSGLPPLTDVGGPLRDELVAWIYEIRGINSDYENAYEAWAEARRAAWITWRDTVWIPWRDRIIEGFKTPPSTKPIVNLRRIGRAAQIESLRLSLDAGVGLPHLAARYLAMPFNIISKPDGVLPAGPAGAVTATAPSGTTHRAVTYALNGAVRESAWVDNLVEPWDAAPFSRDIAPYNLDAPHLLGRDMADPTNLFGWQAFGSFDRLARYRPFHAAERAYVDPRDLAGVTFNDRPGYKALMEKGVVLSNDTTLRVSADGYVPAGTKLTMVQLEYEVFDPYTEQWIWTPHVRITQYDSIWIEDPGDYILSPLVASDSEGNSPRRIRFRRAFEQTRNANQTWTAPKNVPIELDDEKRWQQDVPVSMGFMPPDKAYMWHHPTGVAIVEGLSPAARPRLGTSVFHFGAMAIWPDMDYLGEVLMADWDTAPGDQTLCAAALRAVKKL